MRIITISGNTPNSFCEKYTSYKRMGWAATTSVFSGDGRTHVIMCISEYGFARIKAFALLQDIQKRLFNRVGNPQYRICTADETITKI